MDDLREGMQALQQEVGLDPALIARAERIFELIRENLAWVQRRAFVLGALFKSVRDEKLWQGKATSFNAYIQMGEIDMGHANVYLLIKLHDFYVERCHFSDEQLDAISDINLHKLYKIISVVNPDDPASIDEWLANARNLNREDLKLLVNQERERRRAEKAGLPEPVAEEPEPDPFAVDNSALSVLCKEMIESVFLTDHGVVLRTDSGHRLRVWFDGAALRIEVREAAPKPRSEAADPANVAQG